ncbi:MAG TPA: hypothetical protein DCZ95_06450 [Verrucomicrobia bacterium]|nr:MAG: hypothetical protein A2X46_16215 [Lentisphaerae bacterium GWF2_57_35]HBA83718.1 hypothetical protein [Verrucomicrobiota bacterium]
MMMVGLWALFCPLQLLAQDMFTAMEPGGLFVPGDFFLAVVAGIVLALAFEMLMANVTAAAGLTVAKSITVEKGKSSASASSLGGAGSIRAATDRMHETIRKIGAGFGIWTIVSASIALFFGTWLAVKLAGAASVTGGVILGLVIWGLFYLLSVTIEATAAASMISALAGLVKKGFQSISEGVTSVFAKSEASQQADQAAAITAAVRDELFGNMDIQDQIGKYINEFADQFGPERYRKELQKLIDGVEIKSYIDPNALNPEDAQMISQMKAGSSTFDKEQARHLVARIKDAIQKSGEDKSKGKIEQAVEAGLQTAGMGGEEAGEFRKRMEDYLRRTGKSELNPEGIKRDIMQLFQDPKAGAQALKSRLAGINRQTIEAILSQRKDLSKEEAHAAVEKVFGMVDQIRGSAKEGMGAAQAGAAGMKERALASLEEYLQSLDRPLLNPPQVRHEIELLLNDPKAGAEALIHRAKNMNRDDIAAIISSNRMISREQADALVNQIFEARDTVMNKAQQMKDEVAHRLEQARVEALHQADELRQTAAAAAWWIFASAAVSGVTAALGGWIAVAP